MAIGDFNAILSVNEKKGGIQGKCCPHFGDFIDENELQDLGFRGLDFTWQRRGVFERLDRVVRNIAWGQTFPKCLVTNLVRLKFDHKPLLVNLCFYLRLPKG